MDRSNNNNHETNEINDTAAMVQDGNVISEILKKTLDANKYATKKTIAQGLLDVALLTANASQLKYVLQVGEKHEFYVLMLTLISVSIILQVTAAIISILVSIIVQNHNTEKSYLIAWILNHIALAFVTGALFCDIIKMNFGLDPALSFNDTFKVVQAMLCVILGTSLNINKEDDHPHAERANNIILCVNIVLVAVNILINAFEMKDGDDRPPTTTTTPTPHV